MSQGYSGVPTQPPVTAPPRRGGMPTWLIIVIIVLVLCVVGAVLVCLFSGGLVAFLAPIIGDAFNITFNAALGCQLENSDLDSDACSNWAATLQQDYPDEVEACASIISGGDNNSSSATEYYNCLIDEGVPPPQ